MKATILNSLKALLLITVFAISLPSCKKGDEPVPEKKITIEGNWMATTNNIYFYNADGDLVHTEFQRNGNRFTFKAGKVTDSFNTMNDSYTFDKISGTERYALHFEGSKVADVSTFEVLFPESDLMYWSAESTAASDLTYKENGITKKAAAVVKLMNLSK